MIGLLAALGFGAVAAKQEIGRSFDTIDSRAAAKRKGDKFYVDGYGCTRLTENAHLIISTKDHEGYSAWYDVDEDKIIDRYGYRNHIKEQEETKRIAEERRKQREKEREEEKERRHKEYLESPGYRAQQKLYEVQMQSTLGWAMGHKPTK